MNKQQLTTYIVLILLTVSIHPLIAQNNTSSPYSMYGLGDLKSQSKPVNSAMGNTGIGISSNSFINELNPASLTGIDSMTFIFEVGIDSRYTDYKTSAKTANSNDFNFSYLTLGWRTTPWLSTSFGLNPYSSAGYIINSESYIGGELQAYPLDIVGSGDISRAYLSFGINPIKNLSLGIKNSFLFGSLIQTQYHDLTVIGNNPISNSTTDYFHNFYWEFGMQYQFNIADKNKLILGAIYNPRQKLVTKRLNSTFDSEGTVLQNEEESEGEFIIPQEFGFGLSYLIDKKLLLAADAGIQMWSDESYKIADVDLKNNPYASFGFDYLPSNKFIDKFYKKINYRAGFKYERSYLNMRGVQLDEYTFSLGLGLPIRKSKSKIDLSFEFGKKGTTENNLIEEKYIGFRLGFSLKDAWFMRRQFD